MQSIVVNLTDIFTEGIIKAFPDLTDPPIVIALSGTNPKFGDYQCNSAMPISNMYKLIGKYLWADDMN